jgi:hypothetical protein
MAPQSLDVTLRECDLALRKYAVVWVDDELERESLPPNIVHNEIEKIGMTTCLCNA